MDAAEEGTQTSSDHPFTTLTNDQVEGCRLDPPDTRDDRRGAAGEDLGELAGLGPARDIVDGDLFL